MKHPKRQERNSHERMHAPPAFPPFPPKTNKPRHTMNRHKVIDRLINNGVLQQVHGDSALRGGRCCDQAADCTSNDSYQDYGGGGPEQAEAESARADKAAADDMIEMSDPHELRDLARVGPKRPRRAPSSDG